MILEVRDSNDEVLETVEFERGLNSDNRIQVMSSTGGTTHTYQTDTPLIIVKVNGFKPGTQKKAKEEDTRTDEEKAEEAEKVRAEAYKQQLQDAKDAEQRRQDSLKAESERAAKESQQAQSQSQSQPEPEAEKKETAKK